MRYLNTRFWDDGYIRGLKIEDKLLFLYLITNPLTELCGAYEIGIDQMAFHTGLKEQAVTGCLRLLEAGGRMIYRDGWLYIKNFTKHQSTNPSILKGIERTWSEIPEEIRSQFEQWTGSIQAVDTLPPASSTLLNLTILNTDLIQRETENPTPSQITKNFLTNEEAQAQLLNGLVEQGVSADLASSELKKFISYWTELTPSGTKQRWQIEKTFEVKRRLATWFSNIKPNKSSSYSPNRVIKIS